MISISTFHTSAVLKRDVFLLLELVTPVQALN